jgi:hypothetical protein
MLAADGRALGARLPATSRSKQQFSGATRDTSVAYELDEYEQAADARGGPKHRYSLDKRASPPAPSSRPPRARSRCLVHSMPRCRFARRMRA